MGKEKFCISLNLPGRPGLGIMERGEVWKGPIRFVTSEMDKGPIYLPLEISLFTMVSNSAAYKETVVLFGGDCTRDIVG